MNKFTQAILAGIIREIDRWKATPEPPRYVDHRAHSHAVRCKQLAEQEITPVDLDAFLGVQPTASERTRASRAYAALEDAGLIERLTERFSERTSAIRLLPAGRSHVESLINQRDLPPATDQYASGDQHEPRGPANTGHTGDAPEVTNG